MNTTNSPQSLDAASTEAERRQLNDDLNRIGTASMQLDELDLAAALVLGLPIQRDRKEAGQWLAFFGGEWCTFRPTRSWDHFGALVSGVHMVTHSNEKFEDPHDFEKVTGHSFSAHAYFGGTSFDGTDLRVVVARSAAALLKYRSDAG